LRRPKSVIRYDPISGQMWFLMFYILDEPQKYPPGGKP
jgi:hypothetical protein